MNYWWIAAGALMLVASAATINSRNASPSDHDFAMILFIAAIGSILYGVGVVDPESIQSLIP